MDSLKKYFEGTTKILLGHGASHAGLKEWFRGKGEENEGTMRKWLKTALPKKYAVRSGFVVGASLEGEVKRSLQCDALIFDETMFAPLMDFEQTCIMPGEAILANIEIKSTFKFADIEKIRENAKEVKESVNVCREPAVNSWQRNSVTFGRGNISKAIEEESRPFYCVFAYKMEENKSLEDLEKTLDDIYKNMSNDQLKSEPDLYCIPEKGIIMLNSISRWNIQFPNHIKNERLRRSEATESSDDSLLAMLLILTSIINNMNYWPCNFFRYTWKEWSI